MRRARAIIALGLSAGLIGSCTEPALRVAGSMKFVLGGTGGAGSAAATANRGGASLALVANDEYIVSPRQAKLTFTSVAFKDAAGLTLETSELANCKVTYDRTLTSGTTLLDCPFTAPVGEVAQMQLFFDKSLELLVSDATVGIYSDPAAATKFSTTAPAGGAGFVPYVITIGDGTTRATEIVFATPVTITEGSTPSLYVTLDMIHTIQLKVNANGTSLTANPLNDPVAVFGGLTPGKSSYYSGAPTIEGYKVQGVPSLRVFYDNGGRPLYAMIGPNFCGVDGGPKGAIAAPPNGAKSGGWLGKDANNVIAWALPTTDTWTTYNAYYVMAEQAVIGQSTVLNCKVTASPPPPTDGKTYASGAPALPAPDKSVTLKLLAR